MEPEKSANLSVQHKIKHATDQIVLFRDELRLQMHLANMEAKSAFERLEPQFRRVQQQLERSFHLLEQKEDETELKLHLALMDANSRFQALEEWLGSRVKWLRRKQTQTQVSWDTSKIQMHLAAMDAEDFLREKKSLLQHKMRQSGESTADEIEEAIHQITTRIHKIRLRLSNSSNDSIH